MFRYMGIGGIKIYLGEFVKLFMYRFLKARSFFYHRDRNVSGAVIMITLLQSNLQSPVRYMLWYDRALRSVSSALY